MTSLDPGTSIAEAQDWLREQLDRGAKCPCCTQFAKVYKRQITSTSAVALVKLWRVAGHEFVHFPTVLKRSQADEAKMVHWGLIEDEGTLREDGGRAGYWRVTDLGESFIYGSVTVPKYARIYDGRCLSLYGPEVSMRDALGTKFNLSELLAW